MFRDSIRRTTVMRWGAGLTCLLMLQSLVVAGSLHVLIGNEERGEIHQNLQTQCETLAVLSPQERRAWIAEQINADVHRQKFLGLFGPNGQVLAGNLARLPAVPPKTRDSRVVELHPTSIPGASTDLARALRCTMSNGSIVVVGADLDDVKSETRLTEKAVLMALPIALVLAFFGGGLVAAQASRRLDSVRVLSDTIMAGQLHRRLPIRARTDSFQMLCRHINAMLDRIETLMQEVRAIGDDIAHELRTPLTRLRAKVEGGMAMATTTQEFEQAAGGVLKEIEQAERVVSALLRIREIEYHRRRFLFQKVDLHTIVADMVEFYQPVAEDCGMTLRVKIDSRCWVVGDRDLLIEALSNLVDNALKFGPPYTIVDVMLEICPAGHPRLAVADRGDAISPDEQALVFQRFYRSRATSRRPGSGVGLSLVKAIAELHGIRVFFEPLADGPGKRVVMEFGQSAA